MCPKRTLSLHARLVGFECLWGTWQHSCVSASRMPGVLAFNPFSSSMKGQEFWTFKSFLSLILSSGSWSAENDVPWMNRVLSLSLYTIKFHECWWVTYSLSLWIINCHENWWATFSLSLFIINCHVVKESLYVATFKEDVHRKLMSAVIPVYVNHCTEDTDGQHQSWRKGLIDDVVHVCGPHEMLKNVNCNIRAIKSNDTRNQIELFGVLDS